MQGRKHHITAREGAEHDGALHHVQLAVIAFEVIVVDLQAKCDGPFHLELELVFPRAATRSASARGVPLQFTREGLACADFVALPV